MATATLGVDTTAATVSVDESKSRAARQRIGRRLAGWRQALELTQEELAQELGHTRSLIAHIEIGAMAPSFEVLMKICQKFQVDPGEVLAPTDEPDQRMSPPVQRELLALSRRDGGQFLADLKRLVALLEDAPDPAR